MRAALTIAAFLFVGGVLTADPPSDEPTAVVATDEKPDEKPVSFWMEKKLEYSQDLLRGLAMADFKAVGVSGRQLRTLSRVEGFVRNRNDDYRAHLTTFQRVCDEIVRQAEKENLEGATLAFNQLTVSCVSCHRSLRVD